MPKFLWRFFDGVGYCLMYDGHIEDVELGSPIAMIIGKRDHVHVVSPLTFLNKGFKNEREAMEHVQKTLELFADRIKSACDSNRLWPVM